MIVANKITNTTIQAIEETEMLLSEKDLQKAVDLISKRKQIDLYGIGESAIVAYDASIKFIRINKNVFFSMAETAQRLQAINSNDEHVAIVISYTGETDAPLEIAKILKNNNTPIISITGNSKNRLVKYADCSLFVSNIESTYRTSAAASRTTSLYLIDIFLFLIAFGLFENCGPEISFSFSLTKLIISVHKINFPSANPSEKNCLVVKDGL